MSSDYVHGFTPDEQRRLTRMQAILNEAELRELDLRGVRSLLDVGSGLGQMTRALARAAEPGARVVGIERDGRQLAEARRQAEAAGEAALASFREGDATALPLGADERGTFDLVHARFLLEHLSEPLAAVRQMVDAARPGGRIVLVDDDHELFRLWPDCPPFERVFTVYWKTYRDRGQDPLIGRRLPALLQQAGAPPVRTSTVFFGAPRGGALFEAVVDNVAEILTGAAEAICGSGRVSPEELDGAISALRAWSDRPGAAIWYSIPLAEGRKPA
jgi:SAM-dependent methyltransferase